MTKEEAKKFGLQLLQGIMERNESYPVYVNNIKQAIEALSEPNGSSEIPKGLKEVAWKLYPYEEGYDVDLPYPSTYDENEEQRKAFIAGAKWDREQMMKEAVEGKICGDASRRLLKCGWLEHKFGEPGDKVKLIIVKED